MEAEACRSEGCPAIWSSIQAVSNDGRVQGGQMDAKLVHAPGDGMEFDQGEASIRADLQRLICSLGMVAQWVHVHSSAVGRITAERRVDPSIGRSQPSTDEGKIGFADGALLKLANQVTPGPLCFCQHDGARSLFV